MPNETLKDQIEPIRRAAVGFATTNSPNARQRLEHVNALQNAEERLSLEIEERNGPYLQTLDQEENEKISARREEAERRPNYQRALAAQRAAQERFQNLRRINNGQYPRNISPVLYVIPLILVGVAEWYVNYSTFSAMFIPVFAIAATIIVAAVFAWASHLHGAYIKQISEIMHPSEEYRNILGLRIALVIATILLIAAFATVVWLRWQIISEQLGTDTGVEADTFGHESSSLIWSKVGPTVVINMLIWGLGTLYSWAMHEKVPGIRESYRNFLHASRKVDGQLKRFHAEERRLKAHYQRERDNNRDAIREYQALLEDVKSARERLQPA